jgi:ABC-type branched-subunit amino acid transport system substrate-binding protein
MAIIDITTGNGVLQISSSNTATAFTAYPENDFYFRTAPSDALEGKAMARLAIKEGYKTTSTLVLNNPYGVGFEKVFVDEFKTLGGTVLETVRYDPARTAFDWEVEKVAAVNPDFVMLCAFPDTGSRMLKAAYEKGYIDNIDWLLSLGLIMDDTLADRVGKDEAGSYIIAGLKGTTPDPRAAGPSYETFKQNYIAEYGKEPTTYCSNSYDAAAVVALAIEKAGEATGTAIRDSIRDVANPPGEEVSDIGEALRLIREGKEINYQGASGEITFDENGDVLEVYCEFSIADDGSVVLGKSIELEGAATSKPKPTALPAAKPTLKPTPRTTPTPIPVGVTPSPALPISPEYLYAVPVALFLILLPLLFYVKGKKKKLATTPEMPPPSHEQKEQEQISPPISKSITIERAIYDPCKRDFIEGNLPRMKEWINRYDPGAYWFAVSIQNNTDKTIEEWGVELETSSALKVEKAIIEGMEYKIGLRETHPEPYKNVYAIGVPKEYGIVIPKGGAQRVFFKLRAEKPKTTYEISGVFKSAIGEVPIRAKEFKYLCDAASLRGAILEHPEAALEYVKTQVNYYSPAEVSAIVKGLDIVFTIGRLCASRYPKRADVRSEVEKLKGYLENVEDKLGQSYKDFEMLVREMDAVLFEEIVPEDYTERIKRKCLVFPDDLLAKLQRQSIERGG